MRNAGGKATLDAFLQDQSNSKSVMSLSAAASRRGPSRNKKAAGSEIYPFVALLRDVLAEQLGSVVADRNGLDLVSRKGSSFKAS